MTDLHNLIDRMADGYRPSLSEYEELITGFNNEISNYAEKKADAVRRKIYGNDVYIRGLIEIGNVCRNDCLYCGIRRSNKHCERYTLTENDILSSCKEGYALGFRTFVLQGGEGVMPVDAVCGIVAKIRALYPDCAITLSLGEYSEADYLSMYNAGANRYLLRHETADKEHYEMLHPRGMSFDNRMSCLYTLKNIGFQTGCGFMVGSPYQTAKNLALDLQFIADFEPEMCGIGPFIPHKDTPFANMSAGSAELTVYLLSLIRLIKPNILLPATTALASLNKNGREMGIKSGANVVMPNLSPYSERHKYSLYNNKIATGSESAQNLADLKAQMNKIGYKIVTARGDIKIK